MHRLETSLQMARRHVLENELRIADQEAVLARLKLCRAPALEEVAEEMLRLFRRIQGQARDHLRRLERDESANSS
ncbi:hypothetical protein BKE38_11690 [Pseudoroseomonas deserti]|uniref:Uncharacterized protein n=1 Tax=Teichococcus deserti TaxID=1817963 RepID=A0A1V2H2I3_9PROT|nr:hypothetical protein [Pseudoroseomonas deserti]ONG53550.1 hypothetical protein BKE38_11690 [Pseudoroseomonas deserti]